ncbi:hypothetical protein D3C80_1842040 [compost metagenome]
MLDQVVTEGPRGQYRGFDVREREAGVLVIQNGLAEHGTFLGVFQGQRQGPFHLCRRTNRDLRALVRQLLHQCIETFAFDAAK